ncbi:MAG: DUF951 domain-containing protein [Dehalococcoidia bacterium]
MIQKFEIGYVVRMKKQHPCGGFDWVVYRVGADIGVRCINCERKILMSRADIQKSLKTVVC